TLQRNLNQSVRQQRQLQRDRFKVHQAERIARSQPQYFPLLMFPQPPHDVPQFDGVSKAIVHLVAELVAGFEFRQSLVGRQPFEKVGPAEQNLREKLASDEQFYKDFNRARLLSKQVEQ